MCFHSLPASFSECHYLSVLKNYSGDKEIRYGRQEIVEWSGERALRSSVIDEAGNDIGYVYSNKEWKMLLSYCNKEPIHSISNSTIKSMNLTTSESAPFYPDDYPLVSSNVSAYSWTDTSGDYSQYYWLNDVPAYLWSQGYGPTAAAMFCSYLDRYCPDFRNLYQGNLPLLPEPDGVLDDDKNGRAIETAIRQLASCLGTKDGWTLNSAMCGGIETYFQDCEIDGKYMKSSTDFALYASLLKECHLPVIMAIKHNQASTLPSDHFVLAYGLIYRPSQSLPDVVSHSTWNTGSYFFPGNTMWEYYYVTNVGH